MEEIEKFRDFLGLTSKGYNQAQLRQLQREMQAMAEFLLDFFLYKKRQNGAARRSPKDFDRLTSMP